jgi:hypothetical protein
MPSEGQAPANPQAMLRLLEQLNADPMTIAVWTDATSCVVGDIYCKAPPDKLKRLVSELSLEKLVLKDIASGNF